MKRATDYIIISFFIILLSGCNNPDDNNAVKIVSEEITLNSASTYHYELGRFGDEDGALVVIEPKHSEVSEIIYLEDIASYRYHYKPKTGYTGVDYVEIATNRGASFGPGPGTDQSLIKITLRLSITE